MNTSHLAEWALSHEPTLRLSVFLGIFAIMALGELLAERRARSQSRPRRWLVNLGLSLVDSLVVRLLFPAATVGFAVLAQTSGWGLFHAVTLPTPITVGLSVLLLDLVVYWQHILFHAVPFLWRFHLVHHSDQDLDLTSGIRFHPVEIVISTGLKFVAVVLLGVAPFAAFLFEVLLNASSMFNHANVRLPAGLERWLRWFIVTPDMHRVHHSVDTDESNRNFGFNLSLWDRLFGSYRAEPKAGHTDMQLGVEGVLQPEPRSLIGLLVLPARRSRGRVGSDDAPL